MKFIMIFLLLSQFILGKINFVRITSEQIENCKKKLTLKAAKSWNEDDTENEHEFFKYPIAVAKDGSGNTFIIDQNQHLIKMFDKNNRFVRTIGRKGKGPGDLLIPWDLSVDESGTIHVSEHMSRRIQSFNQSGKSVNICNLKMFPSSLAITPKGNFAVYNKYKALGSKRIVHVFDKKGKPVISIGKVYDDAKSLSGLDSYIMKIDSKGNFVIANSKTPLIRKYTPGGKLISVINYQTPYPTPKVNLNSDGLDIIVDNPFKKAIVKRTDKGTYTIPDERKWIVSGMALDSKNRIYLIIYKRQLTKEESMACRISGSLGIKINRELLDLDIVDNLNVLQLWVISPSGKMIAKTDIKGLWGGVTISQNCLFLHAGAMKQSIYEYEFSIK